MEQRHSSPNCEYHINLGFDQKPVYIYLATTLFLFGGIYFTTICGAAAKFQCKVRARLKRPASKFISRNGEQCSAHCMRGLLIDSLIRKIYGLAGMRGEFQTRSDSGQTTYLSVKPL